MASRPGFESWVDRSSDTVWRSDERGTVGSKKFLLIGIPLIVATSIILTLVDLFAAFVDHRNSPLTEVLMASRADFESGVDRLSDAVWRTDEHGTVWSKKFLLIFIPL